MGTGMRSRNRAQKWSTYLMVPIATMTLILSCAAQAGPITVSLTGTLGTDSPFGSAGTEYVFSFDVDDVATASTVNASGNSASFSGAVTAVSFLTMTTAVQGGPSNTAPDSNLLTISDGTGQGASEDVIQGFVDLPDQGSFSDLLFGFLLLDSHAAGEPEPDSVTSLGLDVFSLLDIAWCRLRRQHPDHPARFKHRNLE